jgi:VWFA-related protein
MREALAVAVLALASWPSLLSAQSIPADAGFGEQIDVDLVNVEVYVTGRDGRPVSGLRRGDFKLLEDGKPMQITNFEAVDRRAASPGGAAAQSSPGGAEAGDAAVDPLHLVVFVDNTQILPGHRTRALRQLRDLLARDLSTGDLVLLATFDPGLHVRLPFTADRQALAGAFDALETASAGGIHLAQARRFAWQQVIDIRELAGIQHDKETKFATSRGGKGSNDEAEDNANGTQVASVCPPDLADPVKVYAQEARQQVLRSISGLATLVSSLSGLPGRKALLHVSDGISVTPGEELFRGLSAMCSTLQIMAGLDYSGLQAMIDAQSYSTAKQWSALAAHASAQQVTLYTLQASGLESSAASAADLAGSERLFQSPEVDRMERENRRGSLVALADGSGGQAILDANDLAPAIARLADDLDHYYSLGYAPPHHGDGRNHTITVKVQAPGVRVRHREIYRDKPPLERVVDHTLASLFQGYEDNPLDVRLEIGTGTPAGKGTWTVPVRLRIPLFKLGFATRNDSVEGKLRVLVAVSSHDGESTPVRQVEVPIRFPRSQALIALGRSYLYEVTMTLSGGEQRLAVAVRDEATSLTSFLARTLRAPEAVR